MIYLDNSNTAPPLPDIMDIIKPFYTQMWGVPGLPHDLGQAPLHFMEKAYRALYELVGCSNKTAFILTSSGAEAVNHVIHSAYMDLTRETGKNHFLTCQTDEAPSILALERLLPLGCTTDMVPINEQGIITTKALCESITPRTALLSLSWGNGMTGLLHPVEELAAICKERGVRLHLDITHVLGKIYDDIAKIDPDYITFNGEQLHAPKGTGALFYRESLHVSPLIIGGGEQGGMRGGTVNVPALIAFGKAAEIMKNKRDFMCTEITRLRNLFEDSVIEKIPEARVFFSNAERLPHISVIAFPNIHNDALLYILSQKGVYASFGGGNFQQLSLQLEASGIDPVVCQCSLSFSLSRETTEVEIFKTVEILAETIKEMRSLSETFFKTCRQK